MFKVRPFSSHRRGCGRPQGGKPSRPSDRPPRARLLEMDPLREESRKALTNTLNYSKKKSADTDIFFKFVLSWRFTAVEKN